MTVTTISDNTTGSYIGDYTGTEDTYMRSNVATTNYGTATSYQLSNQSVTPRQWYGLLSFSGLSNIAASEVASAATVYQYLTLTQRASSTVALQRLLVSWTETVATHTIRETATNWTTAGAQSDGNDRSATVTATISPAGTLVFYGAASAQMTTDVAGMIDGTYSNYGWVQEEDVSADSTDLQRFASKEGADGTRPALVVTHAAGVGGIQPGSLSLMGVGI